MRSKRSKQVNLSTILRSYFGYEDRQNKNEGRTTTDNI